MISHSIQAKKIANKSRIVFLSVVLTLVAIVPALYAGLLMMM